MRVRDLQPRDEQPDPGAAERLLLGAGDDLRHRHQVPGQVGLQVDPVVDLGAGHDQDVAGRDRVDRQEPAAALVPPHEDPRQLPVQDPGEDARHEGGSYAALNPPGSAADTEAMPGRPAPEAPPAVAAGTPSELRLRAAAPLPPLPTVPDFVGLPTGASLNLESRQLLVEAGAAGWLLVSAAVAATRAGGLAALVTWPYAVVLLLLVVGLPGGLAARRALGLLLAEQPAVARVRPTTPVAVVLAAADPASTAASLAALAAQDYDGPVTVVAVADAEADLASARAVVSTARDLRLALELIPPPSTRAVDPRNAALARVTTPFALTVAAGVQLHPSALRLLVARLESCPPGTVGVAGHRLVLATRASRPAPRPSPAPGRSSSTRTSASRRCSPARWSPTASCTLFRTDALRAVNGWPPGEGSDVVVTWRCLERGWTVTSEPQALAIVTAPVTVTTPSQACAAAGRGLRRAARESGGATRLTSRASRFAARVDRARPALDVAGSLGWLQALALLGLGQVSLVGASLVLVAPVGLAGLALERRHHREVLDAAGLTLARPPRRWCATLGALDPCRALAAGWGHVTAPRARETPRPGPSEVRSRRRPGRRGRRSP